MRCSKVRMSIASRPKAQPLSPDISQHLATCEACRVFHERNSYLADMLSLRNRATPPPGSEDRTISAVRQALARQWTRETSDGRASVWDILFVEPFRVVRYATAAVLLLLVSTYLLKMPTLQSAEVSAPVMQVTTAPAPAPAPAVLAGTGVMPVQERPPLLPTVHSISNRSGGGLMEYGPYRSIPVSFDY